MARTKASVGAKVSSGKSSKARCSAAPPTSSSGPTGSSERSSRGNSGGGNPVCPRETPKWQRPITNFFIGKDVSQTSSDADEATDEISAGASKTKPKRNIIESDDEDEVTVEDERPINRVLDETIELEPLCGEDSHKIEEYYPKNGDVKEIKSKNGESVEESDVKGKGKGKKTNKENIDVNIERRQSVKRDLHEITTEENCESVPKKVKLSMRKTSKTP